ncbi:PREDICTED: peptidyl-prolyl cis-trans isomerase CWC27 homolog [Acropora digitifera]|uniref:peptidyl-prolyl cis-trans isomerase CWC27 homolog n=1 Tax=Acropora digitifera TaxID=70779 RepID=UPI00077A04B6|nr:PREDICTED: peptidyl-prolyl cis-trans isomerase CWC27 homolog [Acropora digitifera]
MLKMEDCEVGEDDRPLFPPKIKSTEVLHNPFDDIVPRLRKEDVNKEKTEEKKKKIKGTKNFSLLSFGEEAEEEESEVVSVNKTMKMKSSHDVLQDPKLSSQPVVENTAELGNLKEQKKSIEDASDEDSDNEISPDEEDFDPRMLDQVRSKLKKRKMGNEEKDDLDEKMVKDPSTKRMFHTLMCENEGKRARDAFIEDEDTFEIYDPRNPINKRRRELSKKSMQNKRR